MVLGFKTQIKGKLTHFVRQIEAGTKIHTIRQDANRRWKVGMPIEFATGVRTKQYTQFKSGTCVGIQSIRIQHWDDGLFSGEWIFVDGHLLSGDQIDELVLNDGFDSRRGFFEWFDADFEGRIIHWTNFRY